MSRSGWAQKTISVLVTVLMIGACVLAGLMVLPTLLGYQRYVIISGSMEPTLPVGSVVYDEVVPVADLEVGDIITFIPPPEFDIDDPVTHRIVQITGIDEDEDVPHAGERVFRTKGDANEDVDPWKMVLDGNEQGRVAHHLPYVGYFYMALQVRWVQLLVVVIPALALITYIVVTMWRVSGDAVIEERARQADATNDEDEKDEVPS